MPILYFRMATKKSSGYSHETFLFLGSFLSFPKFLLVVKSAHIKLHTSCMVVSTRQKKHKCSGQLFHLLTQSTYTVLGWLEIF